MDKSVPVRPARFSARFPLCVDVELTDMLSNVHVSGRTNDLSLFGLRVDTVTLLTQGVRVEVRIADRGLQFMALGRVAYSQPSLGMGIVFINVGPEAQRILDQWVAELSSLIDRRPVTQALLTSPRIEPFFT